MADEDQAIEGAIVLQSLLNYFMSHALSTLRRYTPFLYNFIAASSAVVFLLPSMRMNAELQSLNEFDDYSDGITVEIGNQSCEGNPIEHDVLWAFDCLTYGPGRDIRMDDFSPFTTPPTSPECDSSYAVERFNEDVIEGTNVGFPERWEPISGSPLDVSMDVRSPCDMLWPQMKDQAHARSTLRRYYTCTEGNCSVRPFSSRADLLRHRLEVHGKDKDGRTTHKYRYPCPVPGCVRHLKGFSRQWNMHDHIKRIHSKPTPDATVSALGDLECRRAWSRSDSETPSGDPLGVSADIVSTNVLCQGMKRRRDALQAWKRDVLCQYDKKIDALSKAIDAMEEQRV